MLNVDILGGVARVTLNRPEVRNAFDDALIQQLQNSFETLGKDPSVRALVLAGNGPAFCAGADLNWMKRMAGYGYDENLADAQALATMLATLERLPKPTIARVHGPVFAGGTGLVAACDIAVLPSRREGLGVAALEAMAAGRPVVASDVGGLAEVVVDRKTGLLVRAEDPTALAAVLMRQTRNSMIEVLSADYVRTAYAKGLQTGIVVFRHAIRNGLIPVVTIFGLQLGALISGAVVTEQIFVVPGFGRLILEAVFTRDYPIVQGVVLITASAYVLVNLLVDVSYSLLNPRIRIKGGRDAP